MINRTAQSITFDHLIDLPNCNCVYCSVRENITGRSLLFLVFDEQRKIYIRDGIKDIWEEVKDQELYEKVRVGFNEAVMEKSIPCYCA